MTITKEQFRFSVGREPTEQEWGWVTSSTPSVNGETLLGWNEKENLPWFITGPLPDSRNLRSPMLAANTKLVIVFECNDRPMAITVGYTNKPCSNTYVFLPYQIAVEEAKQKKDLTEADRLKFYVDRTRELIAEKDLLKLKPDPMPDGVSQLILNLGDSMCGWTV